MSTTTTKKYRLAKRVKDEGFNVDDLHEYELSLLIGTRDFQFCVISAQKKVVLLEDYRLDGIKTINTRVRVLKEIFDNHHVLSAGFWNTINVCFKTHKYTLVPSGMFVKTSAKDYLAVNSEIKASIESVHIHKHNSCDAVNVFAGDIRMINWLESVYPSKQLNISHQGGALVEGVLKSKRDSSKSLFGIVDRGVMHIIVTEGPQLLYYNQFAIRKADDYLKYTMLVFKELKLNQRNSPVVLWGNLKENSQHTALLRKYIKNVNYGARPGELTYGYQFDEILDHQYFDLFNIPLTK